MKNWITKKNTFITSILAFGVTVLLWVLNMGDIISCRTPIGVGYSIKYCAQISIILLPLTTVIPVSLLTYKLRDEIFRAWIRFAQWWVPISMLIILIIPGGGGGGWGIAFPPLDAVFALYSSGLFLVISLAIIAYKFFQLKKSGVGK